jgi:hypothetical protein
MAVVRRVLALALLGVFSFSLIPLQAFAADDEAGLPACCRRNGKHHCAVPPGEGSSSDPAWQATRCISFPDGTSGRLLPETGVLDTPMVTGDALPICRADHQAVETVCPVLFRSLLQERGPPISSRS